MFETGRDPRIVLQQRDLHAVLAVAAVDLALTITGITSGAGHELNPFYAPLTGSLTLMLAGAAFYGAVLLSASYVLAGDLRRVLGSTVFGMHVGGALSWLAPLSMFPQNWWYFGLAGMVGTALFYRWQV
ncbi:MAG: hypothetical protein ABEK12_03930 [Candidatus Nanohaloarchaea archaeon]